ncbi:MAG: polysaccharide deacetylase [Clostridia bacterium]|nr:polysaccharide deacetylase [Clostridia bacterium]
MRVFIFTKKSLVFTFSIIFIITIVLLSSLSLATEFHNANTASDNFMENVSNLIKGKEKIAYLTFDDGPSLVTSKILDILNKENVKASFFVIGKSVEAHPEIVKRAYDEGHYIANHTYSHNNSILYKSSESFLNEIKKTDIAIGKAIGVDGYSSSIFRFPNGFMSPQYKAKKKEMAKLLSQMNYAYIDWNCLNNDSIKKYTSSQLLNNLKKSSKNKNTLVILMHDTKDVSNSSLALEDSIEYLKSEGYSFRNFYSIVNNLK